MDLILIVREKKSFQVCIPREWRSGSDPKGASVVVSKTRSKTDDMKRRRRNKRENDDGISINDTISPFLNDGIGEEMRGKNTIAEASRGLSSENKDMCKTVYKESEVSKDPSNNPI